MRYAGVIYFAVGLVSIIVGILLMKDFIVQFFKFAIGIILFIIGLQLMFKSR